MGSQSDWAVMKHVAKTLDALKIGHEALIVSAHRTPKRLYEFAKGARAKGFKVVVAGAGGAAHLPGMAASMTSLPVLGVPVRTRALEGKDSAPLHRADAGRHSGRHARDRQSRREERRFARRRDPFAL